jgi:hypothetical protein
VGISLFLSVDFFDTFIVLAGLSMKEVEETVQVSESITLLGSGVLEQGAPGLAWCLLPQTQQERTVAARGVVLVF